MRKLIIVVTLVAAPLVAAAPAVAATADRAGSGSDDAAVMLAGSARRDLANPSVVPSTPQAREAATTQPSAVTKFGGETTTPPRHQRDDAQMAWEYAGAPAAPVARASAGSALARAPPAST